MIERSKKRDRDGLHRRGGKDGRELRWYTWAKVNGRFYEIALGTAEYNEAKRVRQQKIDEFIAKKRLPELARMTFTEAAEEWLSRRNVEPSTLAIEGQRLRPLKKHFGNLLLSDLTPEHIDYYKSVRRKQVSPRTVNLELKVIRQLLKAARLWGRFTDDFAMLKENSRGQGKAITPEQEAKLFALADESLYDSAAFFAGLIAANTTMRGCEIRGLKLKDIDLINRTVTIHRKTTKTDSGERIIPLNNTAAWAFGKLLERARLLNATKPDHFLFPFFNYRQTKREDGSSGTGYDPTRHQKSWRTGWRTLTRRAGLASLRFHDMRHFAITKMAEHPDVSDATMMSIAGHVSKKMLEHYSHIRSKARAAAVSAIDTFKIPEQPKETENKRVN